jgi:signal transduction histidine kinase
VLQAQSRQNVSGRRETILYFRDVTHEDEVDRMKSEFLASAAHELRTPMVSIFGFTELLLRRNFSEERRTDMLQTIHRQSGLLVKMINELLDLARIESRRGLDLHIAEHRLGELVDHSVKGLMRAEGERQVHLADIPDVLVLIDPEKMQLALSNLLSNAFKYSPHGGEVRLSGRLAGDAGRHYAVLEVQDQGIGMTREQLARAFERFYRADTTGNIPGTGLGLSLVREVAGLHNGRVELDSEFGKGTTARLWIPMPANSTAPAGESDATVTH